MAPRPLRPQTGLAAAAIVIVLIVIAITLVAGRGYFGSTVTLDQRATTDANLTRVAESLIRFATLNQRLPCPAAGTSDSGTEDATAPYATCNSPDGVVPWAALALRRSDAIDGWGHKISYRVYSGPTGLTQTGGASMTDCNTNAGATGAVDANGKCPTTRQTPPGAFLSGKGLSVQTETATTPGYAYVLVSHGETGAGAFMAEGGTRAPLPAVGSLEYRNTQSGTTFDNRTRSPVGTPTTATSFFDDAVVATSITDFVAAAKLTGRDWGPPPTPPTISSVAFDTSSVTAAITAGGGAVDFNTQLGTLNFGTFTVTAQGDSARNVGFDTSGTGIGSIGTGVNAAQYVTANRATNEGLLFVFNDPARYLGVTLSHFGSESGELERVSFDFVIGGSTVRVTKMACRSGDGRVNFTVNPGGDFSQVTIEPRLTQFFNYDSTLEVAAIATCPSTNSACAAPGAISSEDCP